VKLIKEGENRKSVCSVFKVRFESVWLAGLNRFNGTAASGSTNGLKLVGNVRTDSWPAIITVTTIKRISLTRSLTSPIRGLTRRKNGRLSVRTRSKLFEPIWSNSRPFLITVTNWFDSPVETVWKIFTATGSNPVSPFHGHKYQNKAGLNGYVLPAGINLRFESGQKRSNQFDGTIMFGSIIAKTFEPIRDQP